MPSIEAAIPHHKGCSIPYTSEPSNLVCTTIVVYNMDVLVLYGIHFNRFSALFLCQSTTPDLAILLKHGLYIGVRQGL